MSPLIQSLRVNCDAIRKEGVRIDDPTPTRHPNMPNVTAAMNEYQSLADKPWGCLSHIARKHHTTPGSILGRINRGKK